MSRMYGHLVTLAGCTISWLAFCFLPYLIVPDTSFAFTGLQLVNSGSQIPLPHYFTIQSASIGNIQGVLQNDQFIDLLLIVLLLIGLLAIAGCLCTLRRTSAKRFALLIIVGSVGTVFFSLCNFMRDVASSFDFMDAHANTLSGIVHGSHYTPGFLGFWLGMLVAFVGSVITLRTGDESELSYRHQSDYRD